MIVDDDPIAVYLLERLIKNEKISDRATGFSGGNAALDHLAKNDRPENFYLIFLDINMPDMSGWQLLDIVEQNPCASRTYFYMVTSSVEQTDRSKIENYPRVLGFLEKPVAKEMLQDIRSMDVFKRVKWQN